MGWTTPRTYADGEILTAAILNADIRDNLLAADQHAHTGAAGDGEQYLSSLDYADLDYQSALAAPAAGHLRFWADSGETLRYRPAGGSELTVSETTHTHTQAAGYEKSTSAAAAGNTTSYGNRVTNTHTPQDSTGSPQYLIVHTGVSDHENTNGVADTVYMRLLKDGVQQQEISASVAAPIGSHSRAGESKVHLALAASSTAFEVETKKGGSGNSTAVIFSVIREVQAL